MNLITRAASGVSDFVKKNITNQAADFVPDEDAQRIDNNYGRIQDGFKDVSDDLDRLDADTEVRMPALKNFKNSELIIGGAAAGALAGAAIGLGKEVLTASLASPNVDIVETEHEVYRTVLQDGNQPWTETKTEVLDSNGAISGFKHTFEAATEQDKLGTYTTREAQAEGVGNGSPLTAGLIGMGVGAGVGALAGAGLTVARNFIAEGKYDGSERRESNNDNKLILRTGLAGAGLGFLAGGIAGGLEAMHNETLNFNNEQLVTETEVIGQMPGNYTESVFGDTGNRPPMQNIEVNNPVVDGRIFKGPKIEKIEQSVEAGGRYSALTGALGGAAVGAVAGVTTGVLVNVIRKTI